MQRVGRQKGDVGLEIVGTQVRGDALRERSLTLGNEQTTGDERGERGFYRQHQPMIPAARLL